MEQTPIHEYHNPDLLKVIPLKSQYIVEVGCSSGALDREYKKISNANTYVGIEVDDSYASLAKRYCDEVYVSNIETMEGALWNKLSKADCWIFGDTLEHLQNPWKVLHQIHTVIPSNGVIACYIPNAQHWSLQVKLNIGEFRYEESGLLDKTHLRWFTKKPS
jgi:tRNA A58 N-methylase Trm61